MNGTARGYTGSPEQASRAFLNDHRAIFGIENIREELQIARSNESKDGRSRVQFQQMYQGLPVINSGYLVARNAEGAIHYVSGDYYPDIQVNTSPRLRARDVVDITQSDLGGASSFSVRQEPVLSVFIDTSGEELAASLAYETRAERRNPIEAYKYVVDAHSGEVLQKISLVKDTYGGVEREENPLETFAQSLLNPFSADMALPSGTGNVYTTNPLHGSFTSVTLHRLDDVSPRVLEGNNIAVTNEEASEAASSTGNFAYTPSNTHFDEVMTYYHSDEFEAWLIGDLGMETDRLDCQITAETHSSDFYAATIPTDCQIWYSDGDNISLGNPTRERAILNHEYMHNVSETYNSLSQDFDAGALDEGYSDFFAVGDRHANTNVTSTRLGAYVGLSLGRTVDNSYQLDDFNAGKNGDIARGDLTGDGSFSVHDGGVVLAGALWDVKETTGNVTLTAELALESLNYLDNDPSFFDARNAMLTAANSTGNSQLECDIKEAFEAHGIGNAFSAAISGPSTVNSGQEATWTAEVECGEGSTSYSWGVREPGSINWTQKFCSGNSCSHTFSNFDDQIQDGAVRVSVTRGSETVQADQTVFVSPDCADNVFLCPATQVADLRSFEAEPQDEKAQLAWTTTGGMGEGAFLVQHRADSTAAWSDLQTVEASDMATADSTDAPAYRVDTDALAPGTHQFRLQWTTGDETALLSDVIEAEITLSEPYRLRAYPNPVRGALTVESAVDTQQHVRVQIYDVLGRRVTTVYDGPMVPNELNRFTVQPAAEGLSSGTYFLRMVGEDFQTTSQISVVR